MNFYRLLTALIVLYPARATAAQSQTVSGVVVDTAGKPVSQAQVVSGYGQTITGRDGRFRLKTSGAPTCSFSVLAGFGSANIRLDTCPDTTIRIVVRRRVRGESSVGPRCGSRSMEPCTDREGTRFIIISSGRSHSCGISVDSVAYCWGDGRSGQLGNGHREVFRFPQRVLGDYRFASIESGGAFTCALTASGEVHCWGNERTVPGWPHQPEGPVRVTLDQPATSLAVGRRHACVLSADGRASCWGWNVDGETGTGTSGITQSMVMKPTPVSTQLRFASLSAGMGTTCGVTMDGGVACWGSNVDNVLGATAPERCADVGSVPCSTRPVSITLPERIVQVSAGSGHACALGEQEGVYCWGANRSGQAGVFRSGVPVVRTPTAVTLPVQGRVVSLSSGGIQTCALTSARLVYCWGADNVSFGGDISGLDQVLPRLAADGRQFSAVSSGQVHICAIDTGGRLRCWGDTILGALGVR